MTTVIKHGPWSGDFDDDDDYGDFDDEECEVLLAEIDAVLGSILPHYDQDREAHDYRRQSVGLYASCTHCGAFSWLARGKYPERYVTELVEHFIEKQFRVRLLFQCAECRRGFRAAMWDYHPDMMEFYNRCK